MRRALVSSLVLVVAVGVSATTWAHSSNYMSKHPLPRKVGRGFCYIDVPHFHDYAPSDPRLYRQVDGQFYFVGDPAPFDYEGQRFSYYGAHPVVDASVHLRGPTYCYLRGPHYHWYAPSAAAQFELRGGAYWYVGTYEPVFYSERPRYVVVNDVYAPIVYTRPIVDIRVAPPAFRGEIVAGGPGWRAGAVVGAPMVSAGVVVAAPPPPVVHVGVGVGVGVGVNMGGPPPVVYHDRHDNGRHRGWNKPGKGWNKHDNGWRGPPPPGPAQRGGGWRGNAVAPPPAAHGGGWRGNAAPARVAAPQGGGWRGNGAAQQGQHKGGGKGGGWRR